jgi:hydroxyacylglutathione hydrolase
VRIICRAVPPFYKNGFVVLCEDSADAVVIDPGDEAGELIEAARSTAAVVHAILLTHAHVDHITGVNLVEAVFPAPVWLHRDDLFLYEAIGEQASIFGLTAEPQPPVDRFYEEGESIRFGRCVVDVLHTPGHCPGGVCLAIGPTDEPVRELFVGDTLFAGSIGRTDLPGGSQARLLDSIRRVLFRFPDATIVHPGHGPDTTIGQERRTNPFLVGA